MLTESTILAMDLSLVARQPKPAREMVIPIFPSKEGSQYRTDSGEVKDGASRCGRSTLVQSPEKSSAIRKYAAIGRQY
jgi:hypothetical protein